jgi:vacuolar-type H+-ATPase subunit E/Vma4
MDRKKQEQESQEKNAEQIVARIREESARETEDLLAKARKEAEDISSAARTEAERRRAHALGEVRRELDKLRERIFSSVNLEKKRIVLEEKNSFIRQVLQAVGETAAGFRQRPGYDDFLRRAVVEGAKVVGGDSLEIVYAAPDDGLFAAPGFILQLESLSQNALEKTVTYAYTRGDFTEPGVIIRSLDGRIQFDNRFSRRLGRLEGEIYARLLKE